MVLVRVVLVGFGSVGRSLAKLIAYKGFYVRDRFNVDIRVVGVVDSRGMAFKVGGFDGLELLKLANLPRSSVSQFTPYAVDYVDLNMLYDTVNPDVHVELTPSNYESGAPSLGNVMLALRRGAHVVTASKAPLVLAYDEVMGLARSRGLRVRFSATVMGGSPFVKVLEGMRSHEVVEVEGILNATTNFILTLMEDELVEFEEALRRAQLLGVAEANPDLDINGVDAAAKLVIISNILGKPVKLDNVRRVSLATVKLKDVITSIKENQTIKYVAKLDLKRGEAAVEPRRVKRDDTMAQVKGTLNMARIRSDVGDYVFIGKGGGGLETAHTVLNDIIEVAEVMVAGGGSG